jgi:receptor protein-tyrosine kinase
MGVEYITGVISASVEESTNILTLSVTDAKPERAQETLLAVVENYPEFSEMIVGKVNLNLLDETGVPTATSNRRDWINPTIKGATIGAAIGLLWVAFVSIVRKTIRRESDCIKYANKVCIGSVPYVREKKRSTKKKRYLNIMDTALNPDFKEAIRIVRNKVERSTKEHVLKTILVTSALAGEGKSTIAVNLAISLAQEGKRVALVDCDLRNPTDHEILGLDIKNGLVDYLKQTISIKECIHTAEALHMPSEIKLAFVPGGNAVVDGANYLADERMRLVIKSLEEQMDYVILDSAPVGLMTDAGVLAQHADGAIFVVKKDFASADYILNGMQHLTDNSTHIIGCVINGD